MTRWYASGAVFLAGCSFAVPGAVRDAAPDVEIDAGDEAGDEAGPDATPESDAVADAGSDTRNACPPGTVPVGVPNDQRCATTCTTSADCHVANQTCVLATSNGQPVKVCL